jgi:hypothetical protein
MPKKLRNTKFNYLYRDASNYKAGGETVIFRGEWLAEYDARLRRAFFDGDLFIHLLVDIPSVRFEDTSEFGRDLDDHAFHTYESLEATDESATETRSIKDFVRQCEEVGRDGWIKAVSDGRIA